MNFPKEACVQLVLPLLLDEMNKNTAMKGLQSQFQV